MPTKPTYDSRTGLWRYPHHCAGCGIIFSTTSPVPPLDGFCRACREDAE